MVSILKLNSSKPAVKDVISNFLLSPEKGKELARRGVKFSGFKDWLEVAKQSLLASPHVYFWRRLALSYPDSLLIDDLSLFFQVLDAEPLLAEQSRALLFSLPVKKLPSIFELEKLSAITLEKIRVKSLLKKKKELGEEKFYNYLFSRLIIAKNNGKISFSLTSNKKISRFAQSSLFESWHLRKKRISTIFGPATLVTVDRENMRGGIYLYILPDGAKFVKKVCLLDYDKIRLNRETQVFV